MRLLRLALRDFRNYEHARLDFASDFNLIHGANAQGKSNLLEAIYFLIVGRSFRGAKLHDLIRHGSSDLVIEALFERQRVTQTLQVQLGKAGRFVQHNATRHTSLMPLLGLLAGVVFSPGDCQLIHGAPALRRRYLDLHLSQTDPLYVRHLGRYHRALKQRNCLLQSRQEVTQEMWEMEMARSAAYLIERRTQVVQELELWANEMAQRISGEKEEIRLSYKATVGGDTAAIAAAYARNRKRELQVGHTLIGPHRDELLIALNGREARQFASVGQVCCCAIALRLAEWHRLHQEVGEPPLMLLDDATAPLDPVREQRFHRLLEETGQLFLASPQPLTLPDSEQRPTTFHRISGGVAHSAPAMAPLL